MNSISTIAPNHPIGAGSVSDRHPAENVQPHKLETHDELPAAKEIAMNNLAAELKRGGLRALPAGLDDFDWRWPAKIERDVIERAFTLHFCPRLATSF